MNQLFTMLEGISKDYEFKQKNFLNISHSIFINIYILFLDNIYKFMFENRIKFYLDNNFNIESLE